jgi:DNA-binding MarR family transcriptional regulator
MKLDLDVLANCWNERFTEANPATVALASRITRVALQHDLFHSRMLRHSKLTHAEYIVLASLRNLEPRRLTPGELGQTVMQTPAGVTRTVDRLERAGLVMRSRTSADRRLLLVELTASGAKMADKLFHVDLAAHEALLKPLDTAQRRRIDDAMRLLNDVFQSHLAARLKVTEPEDGRRMRQRHEPAGGRKRTAANPALTG